MCQVCLEQGAVQSSDYELMHLHKVKQQQNT